jgi:hypothetical protein
MKSNPSITQMFSGIRIISKKVEGKVSSMPIKPQVNLTKNLFKSFEKVQILTQPQYNIVKEQLESCTEKTSPEYIAKLCALLEKPVTGKLEEKK